VSRVHVRKKESPVLVIPAGTEWSAGIQSLAPAAVFEGQQYF
jgi:hypothetical protein